MKDIKKSLKAIFLVCMIILTIWIIYSNVDMDAFIEILNQSDKSYFLLAVLCLFFYWLLEAFLIEFMLKKLTPQINFWCALKVTLIGQFYSYVTPFASGGQPMQAYYLSKKGVSISNASALLISKFLLFQITVTVYALVMFFYKFSLILSDIKIANHFIMIGILINTVGLSLITMMAYKPKIIGSFLNVMIRLLSHIRLIQHKEKVIDAIHQHIDDYLKSIDLMTRDLKHACFMLVVTVVQITCYFSMAYFVYLGLGLRSTSFQEIISLQALLYIAVAFIPIPGTVGVSEAGYHLIMSSIFAGGYLSVSMIVWRMISYYLGLLLCGSFTLWVHIFEKHEVKDS